MPRLLAVAAALVPFATLIPATAHALAEAAELEAARANARAGGPVSERDAELLRRYGCSSGTVNPVCPGQRYRPYRGKRYRPYQPY